MTHEEYLPEADALDAVLDGQHPAAPADLAVLQKLATFAAQAQPNPGFAAGLEGRLLEAAGQRSRPARPWFALPRLIYPLAGAVALVALLLFGAPLLLRGNTLPGAGAPPAASNLPGCASPAETTSGSGVCAVPAHVAQTTPAVSPGPALPFLPRLNALSAQAAAQEGGAPFSKTDWTLVANMPQDVPQALTVYRQAPDEELTPERAKAVAQQLGLDGVVYRSQGELMGAPVYYVVQGGRRVWFMASPGRFTYTEAYNPAQNEAASKPALDQQMQGIETFLKQRGLLDFSYQIEALPVSADEFQIVRLIDGYRLREDNPFNPRISVSVDQAGAVSSVMYQAMKLDVVGQYPLRSAESAWQLLRSGQVKGQVAYEVSSLQQPSQARSWQRAYTSGQRVDLYGYLDVLEPLQADQPPLLSINNLRLDGAIQDLPVQEVNGVLLHVWGEVRPEESVGQYLVVQGWERATVEEEDLTGVLQRKGDAAWLVRPDGTRLSIPSAPVAVADGETVDFQGVRLPGNTLEWRSVQVGEQPCFNFSYSYSTSSGGGGGGGGGGDCSGDAPVNSISGGGMLIDNGPTPQPEQSPTPPPYPYQPGDAVEALVGELSVTFYNHADGSRTAEYIFNVPAGDGYSFLWGARLSGSLDGIEALHNLQVRLWGRFEMVDDRPGIVVERYEAAVPGQHVQAWFGDLSLETVQGRKAAVLTTAAGEKLLLIYSLGVPEQQIETAYAPRKGVVVEGCQIPGVTMDGFTAVREFGVAFDPGRTSLEGYELSSASPAVIDEGEMELRQPENLLEGVARVEEIKLVYYTPDLGRGFPAPSSDDPGRFVQPLWSFSGSFEDGRRFEVLVQAVDDAYLK